MKVNFLSDEGVINISSPSELYNLANNGMFVFVDIERRVNILRKVDKYSSNEPNIYYFGRLGNFSQKHTELRGLEDFYSRVKSYSLYLHYFKTLEDFCKTALENGWKF